MWIINAMSRHVPKIAFPAGLVLSALVFCTTAGGPSALAQGLPAVEKPADIVQARQLLMDAIEDQMMPIQTEVGGKDLSLDGLKANAYMINTLISAFPHLFPAQTKPPVGKADPGYQTMALPKLWQDYAGFYKMSQAAAGIALDGSQASSLAAFREQGAKLQASCDGCHAKYMHPIEDPKVP